MRLIQFRITPAFLFVVPFLWASAQQPASPPPPNIVLILADDLGWSDIGANSSTFYLTPHIDSLARSGIRFTDAYASAPVCSPTRAALMTGWNPARLHITDWLPGRGDRPDQKLNRPEIRQALAQEDGTLPKLLKKKGYVSAHVGKWHLGGQDSGPLDHGFDVNIAGDHTGTPLSYFAPFRRDNRFMPALEQAEEGEYLTDRLADEAVRFIEAHREKPFFLYLSHYAPHTPLHAKQSLIERHARRTPPGSQTNAIYAAMVESLDDSVGRVLTSLRDLGLEQNTVVIFTSDNGGLSTLEGPNTPATSNAPLRHGKGYLHEGGIRVPLLVRWPDRIPAGSDDRTPVNSADLYATILSLAGAEIPESRDGWDLSPLLFAEGPLPTRPLYWHYPHYANQVRSPQAPSGGGPGAAMREGRWKLIQHFETGHHELYDLETDVGETTNLAERQPERVLDMGRRLFAWQNAARVQWPTANPGHTPRPLVAQPDGSILLHSRDAQIRGQQLRYEPQPHKNTLGYWTRQQDWAEWILELQEPGEFEIEVLQGCGRGSGGAEVAIEVDTEGQAPLTFLVEETGGFQNFVRREVGRLSLPAGKQSLRVRPQTKPGPAVMDLREIRLRPVP